MAPLFFLGVSVIVNIFLDILFVVVLGQRVGGAALATIIAQAIAGIGIGIYVFLKEPELRPKRKEFQINRKATTEVIRHSAAACIQQSVMNFGILMIQGLVNSFGSTVMAAFTAVVKIDSFAYMPAQEFGNAFSLFISQNYGGGKPERVREGVRKAGKEIHNHEFLYKNKETSIFSGFPYFLTQCGWWDLNPHEREPGRF